METINNYLENMFATLPRTAELLNMKNEILGNMTEKYNELKEEGKTENEAIGIVISEFGNIDEIMNEMGVHYEENQDSGIPYIELEEAQEYIDKRKSAGKKLAFGVSFIIFGVALLVLFASIGTDIMSGSLGYFAESLMSVLGVIILFICVIIGVGMIIYSGMGLRRYDYLDHVFETSGQVRSIMQEELDYFLPTYTATLVTGVCLCIASPIPVIALSLLEVSYAPISGVGVALMLMLVSAAVFLFIYYGGIKNGYNKILQVGDYAREKKENNKVVEVVASIVWPLTTVAFLVWGLVFDGFHIAWVLFPVVGICFGAFSSVCSAITGNGKNHHKR